MRYRLFDKDHLPEAGIVVGNADYVPRIGELLTLDHSAIGEGKARRRVVSVEHAPVYVHTETQGEEGRDEEGNPWPACAEVTLGEEQDQRGPLAAARLREHLSRLEEGCRVRKITEQWPAIAVALRAARQLAAILTEEAIPHDALCNFKGGSASVDRDGWCFCICGAAWKKAS